MMFIFSIINRSTISDEALVKKIAKGDLGAFEFLVQRHQAKVYGFCLHLLGNRESAEDIAQETWIRVAKFAGGFEFRSQVLTWIFSIGRNLCLNEVRKKNLFQNDNEIATMNDGTDLENLMIQAQEHGRLIQFIDQLPDNERVILVLWLSGEKKQSELAQELNISVGSIKVKLHRIQKKLKEKMQS